MSFRNFYTENILLPLSDILLGRNISSHFRFLNKSQWWPKEKLEDYQNQRLRLLVSHAYKNVDYYKKIFDTLDLKPGDIKTKEDLIKLPILTKEAIRANFPESIIDRNLKKGTYYNGSTSGSTGEPLKYYISKNAYSFNVACGLRAWTWMGYRLGDKYIKISQNQRKTKEKQLQDRVMNNDYLFLKNIDEETLMSALAKIENVNPLIIRCYPDPLEFLADIIETKKYKYNSRSSLKAIATTGNVLHQHAREKIEKAFQTKIFDGYSCEGSAPFFECTTHECYHGAMEYGISEFVDIVDTANGMKQGRHIVTNLWNFATPFIRYDSQDIVEWIDEKCNCGRNLLPIKRILGRDNDVLVTTNGKKIIVHIFTIYFSKVDNVKQFQVIQENKEHVNLNLVVEEKFTAEQKSKILNDVKAIFNDDNMIIEINIVEKIQVGTNGKRRFLINNSK